MDKLDVDEMLSFFYYYFGFNKVELEFNRIVMED